MKKLFALLIIPIFALLTGCSQIDTGNVGIESTLGQVKAEILPPGVYFTVFKKKEEKASTKWRHRKDSTLSRAV